MILLLLKAIYFYGLTLEITANFNTNMLSIDPRLYVFTYTAHLQISEWFIGMHSCTQPRTQGLLRAKALVNAGLKH
jgi:hypothetical protein